MLPTHQCPRRVDLVAVCVCVCVCVCLTRWFPLDHLQLTGSIQAKLDAIVFDLSWVVTRIQISIHVNVSIKVVTLDSNRFELDRIGFQIVQSLDLDSKTIRILATAFNNKL